MRLSVIGLHGFRHRILIGFNNFEIPQGSTLHWNAYYTSFADDVRADVHKLSPLFS
jgi:hypothetical protein